MKNIVIAILATLFVSGCLFSKKEEVPADAAPVEQTAPVEGEAAPAGEPAHTEPAPAE